MICQETFILHCNEGTVKSTSKYYSDLKHTVALTALKKSVTKHTSPSKFDESSRRLNFIQN